MPQLMDKNQNTPKNSSDNSTNNLLNTLISMATQNNDQFNNQYSTKNNPSGIVGSIVQGATSPQSLSGTMQQSPTGLPQAAIDAASKVQKDYYTKHAEDVVSSSPDGISVLNQLIDSHNNSMNQQDNSQKITQAPQQNKILPATSMFSKQTITPEGNIQLGGLFDFSGLSVDKLATLQKLASGQPSEIAVPLAQAAELNQKIAGAEPIQPKDIADLNRQTYTATITAANDAWQRNNEEIAKMQEQYKTLQEGRSNWGKTFGGQNSQMKSLQNVIIEKMKQNQNHMKNLQTIMSNPPKAIDTQQQNSPFQVGQQYNGETIKNVKRIK